MTRALPTTSPLQGIHVALDLETTGLDCDRDDIIEIGAIKFRGTEVLGSFETLVNPRRSLPTFITQLTGIKQHEVDAAPPISSVMKGLVEFLGQWPIVGHTVAFDLGFLTQNGLHLSNPHYDTQELASVFIPNASQYSLVGLARALGITFGQPHRALEDARICQHLFIALVQMASMSDPGLLEAINAIAQRSAWPLRDLFQQLKASTDRELFNEGDVTNLKPLGLDLDSLRNRLEKPLPLQPHEIIQELDTHTVVSFLDESGPFSKGFPSYEYRPQQIQMARAVTSAMNHGDHLMLEAGTGVGKSVAYLLPAILFAVRNGRRVVISTNTINLQEQLVTKDIPTLLGTLQESHSCSIKGFKYTHLKGKNNYLCYRRWAYLAQQGILSPDEARLLSKTLIWMHGTCTGDHAELNIPGRDSHLWDKVSALGAGECFGGENLCFLRTARKRAEGAHIVVVNHALLLSDVATGGALIPQYDYLIVDEAHHLEDEASRQFGYEMPGQTIDELTTRLELQIQSSLRALRNTPTETSRLKQAEHIAGRIDAVFPRIRESWGRLMSSVSAFVEHYQEKGGQRNQLHITRTLRKQPAWSGLELLWEEFTEMMFAITGDLDRLLLAFEPLEIPSLKNPILELRSWHDIAKETQLRMQSFLVQPDDEYVYWITLRGRDGMPNFNAAPLRVDSKLNELLFSKKSSVILTSATLSIDGSMDYVRERLGFPTGDELLVGSPFDFKKAVLLITCPGMPEPIDPGYQHALQDALVRIARGSRGGILALFTSHAALRTTRHNIKPILEGEGISVVAQGIDGSPQRLLELAAADRNTVLLGTNSLWEGIDMPGDLLRVVVIARLPFNVPSDPLFSARSEQFTDAFHRYAVPQAVLRFRQGFGRLIRRKDDRGVVIVLDQRILSKSYGATFLGSLPPCTLRQTSIHAIENEVRTWLSNH